MKRIIIDSEGAKQRAAGLVRSLSFDPPMLVEIKKYEKNRTLAQNRLLMLWCNALSSHWFISTGEVFDAWVWKEQVKKDFLGVECFELPDGSIAHRVRRTRDLKVHEFTAFLEKIDAYAASELEFILPHPDDLWFEAMGVKR